MTKSILIVDDDSLTRDIMRVHLESHGYRIEEAQNGIKAIEAIKNGKIDAMVLDILMPVSDGIEVLVWLKKEGGGKLPVVVFTQADENSTLSYKKIAEQFGAIKSFPKPITEENVHSAVALLESAMEA
jgi:CheY-like chemotaxis protein